MKTVRAIAAGLALAAVSATQASATSWAGNGSYCGGSAFSTCFSVDLSWTYNGGGPNYSSIAVLLQLKNDDTFNAGLKWFSVGIDNLPAGVTGVFDTGPAGYQDPPPNDFSGSPYAAGETHGANPGGSAPGTAFRSWTFTISGSARTAAQWDAVMNAAGVGYHAGGTVCPSTKVVVRDNLAAGSAYGTNTGPDSPCDVPDISTVPEPATMGLLALGLVGMAGVGRARRRKV